MYQILPDGRQAKSKEFYLIGNKVIWDEVNSVYKYKEDGVEVNKENIKPCPVCKKLPADHCDPCLGKLPGVINACCGHGLKKGYVKFENGIKIEGHFVVSNFSVEKKNSEEIL